MADPKTSHTPTSNASADNRKPFVRPTLTCEADLVDKTADRVFTFTSQES